MESTIISYTDVKTSLARKIKVGAETEHDFRVYDHGIMLILSETTQVLLPWWRIIEIEHVIDEEGRELQALLAEKALMPVGTLIKRNKSRREQVNAGKDAPQGG